MGESTQEVVRDLFKKRSHNGTNLVDHVSNVIANIVRDPSKGTYGGFESTSSFVKKHTFAHTDLKEDYQVNTDNENWTVLKNYINESMQLLKSGDAARHRAPTNGIISDLESDFQMFNWAGVGFREEIVHKLSLSLRKLLVDSGSKQLRFWGKIYGIEKDYYVAEGDLGTTAQGYTSRETESRGSGANKYTYWVTDNIMEDWIELPDATPEQILTSRHFKYIFRGNLNAKVISQPKFPGKERHLLRAQIARISAATVLAPKDSYRMQEEEEGVVPDIEAADDFAMPEDLTSTENWIHLHQYLHKNGRTAVIAPENTPEDDLDEVLGALKEADPEVERLREVNADDPFPGMETAYVSRVVGDTQQYNKESGVVTYAVNVVKPLWWPGAMTVSQNGKWANVYVGYGIRHGALAYKPQDCQEIFGEPDDNVEFPEPNHKDEPKVEVAEGEEGEEGEGEGDDD